MPPPDVTVRGTPEAAAAVAALGAVVNGLLLRSFDNLRRHGGVLTDPEVWDGRAATNFRTSVWPAYLRALGDLHTQLDRLRARLGEIQADIERAG
jgi:hypothetical protein